MIWKILTLFLLLACCASLAAASSSKKQQKQQQKQKQQQRHLASGGSHAEAAATTGSISMNGQKHRQANTGQGVLNLEKARTLIQKTLSLIYNRYEMFQDKSLGKQFVRSFTNANEKTWDTVKYKYATKILRGNDKFHFIFGGSSVTAGHDNFLNQSYPYVFERRLRPAMEALGLDFIVRNIAMGGMGCYPEDLCYEPQGGDDADVYSWEQSYFCKTCAEQEMVARSALYSKNKGLYMELASGNSCHTCNNKESKDPINFAYEEFTPESAGLKEWLPTQAEVDAERTWYAEHSNAGSYWGSIYPNVGSFVSGMWRGVPNCKKETDGGCSPDDVFYANCTTMRFINSQTCRYWVTGGGAKHHPAGAMHMFRGEVFAWIYGMIMLDAINMVEKGLEKAASRKHLLEEYEKVLDVLRPDVVPPPKLCAGYHCDVQHQCYTDYRPSWNPRLSLKGLALHEGNWSYSNPPLNGWQLRAGYLDTPVSYSCGDAFCGDLSLKFSVNETTPYIYFIGTFKNVTVYVDPNVPETKMASYHRPAHLKPWAGVDMRNLMEVNKLPGGTHVVTLAPNPLGNPIAATLTHILTWK